MSGTTSAGPAARKSRALDARNVSAGRSTTPPSLRNDAGAVTPSAPRIVAGNGERHAARSTPAAYELPALEGDRRALSFAHGVVAGEKVVRRNDSKPHLFELP